MHLLSGPLVAAKRAEVANPKQTGNGMVELAANFSKKFAGSHA